MMIDGWIEENFPCYEWLWIAAFADATEGNFRILFDGNETVAGVETTCVEEEIGRTGWGENDEFGHTTGFHVAAEVFGLGNKKGIREV